MAAIIDVVEWRGSGDRAPARMLELQVHGQLRKAQPQEEQSGGHLRSEGDRRAAPRWTTGGQQRP